MLAWVFSTHQIANWPSKRGKQLHTVEIRNPLPLGLNHCNRLTVPPPFTSKTPMKGKHQVHPGIGVQTMQQGYKSCDFNDGVAYLVQNMITSFKFRFCFHPFFHYYGIIWTHILHQTKCKFSFVLNAMNHFFAPVHWLFPGYFYSQVACKKHISNENKHLWTSFCWLPVFGVLNALHLAKP